MKKSSSSPMRRTNSAALLPETGWPDARRRTLSSATLSDLGSRRNLASRFLVAFVWGLGLEDLLELWAVVEVVANMSEMSCCFRAGAGDIVRDDLGDYIVLEEEFWGKDGGFCSNEGKVGLGLDVSKVMTGEYVDMAVGVGTMDLHIDGTFTFHVMYLLQIVLSKAIDADERYEPFVLTDREI